MDRFEEFGILEEKKRNYEGILYVTNLIHGVLEKRFHSYFAARGTSAPKYNILMALAYINGGEGLNQSEIGSHLITSPGNVTKLVDSLCRDGYATRRQSKSDRRENIVKITKKGADFIEALWPEYDAMARKYAGLIPQKKQKAFIETLKAWYLAIEADEE